MESSTVRNRLNLIIDAAKRSAAERKTRNDEASRSYERVLEFSIPLFKQVAQALKVSGYSFTVFTPGGSVKLLSDKSAEDYIELSLDTSTDRPFVLGRTSRTRGRRVIESEHPIAHKAVADLTEEDVFEFVLKEIAPFVER
jgi:hypothetical protein